MAKAKTSVVICSWPWMEKYFGPGGKTGMTFAKTAGTQFINVIHKDAGKRGHKRKKDGKLMKSTTKFSVISVKDAIKFMKAKKLVLIRQIGGNKPNFFKIMKASTAKDKGMKTL